MNLNSGQADLNLISFDGSSNCFFNLYGGELRLRRGDHFQGIFSSAGGHINFANENGTLFIDNLTTATMGTILTDGRIQYQNQINTNVLSAVDEGTGIRITAASPAPSIPPAVLSATLTGGLLTLTATNLTVAATNSLERAAALSGSTWTTVSVFVATGTATNISEAAAQQAAYYRLLSF